MEKIEFELLGFCIKYQNEMTKLGLRFMLLEEPKIITTEFIDKFYNDVDPIFESFLEIDIVAVSNNDENSKIIDLILDYQAAMLVVLLNLRNNDGCIINDAFIDEFTNLVNPLVDKLVELDHGWE